MFKITTNALWMLLLFALLLLVQSGSALRCWECSSDTNTMCDDPMNATEHQHTFSIRTCELSHFQSPKPVCRKIVKREMGQRIVVRSCTIPQGDEVAITDGECSHSQDSSRNRIESCHICSTDLCNSAVGAVSTRPLIAAALLLLAYRSHERYTAV